MFKVEQKGHNTINPLPHRHVSVLTEVKISLQILWKIVAGVEANFFVLQTEKRTNKKFC